MAMSVVYTTINGEILHEVRNGVEHYYVPDTNGNTVQLLDAAGNKTDEWTYWPFGEVRARTGTTATPFTFGGALGYYTDTVTGRMYVRARYLRADLARWQTVDPLWPVEPAYGYASNSPILVIDPSGRKCFSYSAGSCPGGMKDPSKIPGCLYFGNNCSQAETDCCTVTGNPFTIFCTDACTDDCVNQHEAIHVQQLTTCCSKYALCVKKYPFNSLGANLCATNWDTWHSNNLEIFECEAYSATATCWLEDAAKFGTSCAKELLAQDKVDVAFKKTFCDAAKSKKKMDCPFRPDGQPPVMPVSPEGLSAP